VFDYWIPSIGFQPAESVSHISRPTLTSVHCTVHKHGRIKTQLSPTLFAVMVNFYLAMLCIRGTSHGPVFVCVRPSVTSRSSTKTAKRRITQTTPHDTPGSLVFWCQRSPRNSTGVTPYEGTEFRWVVKIGDFRQITGYISKTVKDRHIVSIKVE